LALPGSAVAQQDPVKNAERLNKKAMEDYDALEFEAARTKLQSAMQKLLDAGQDETATAAKVYISLGMVYIAGFHDKNRGVQQFTEALKIDGTVQLDPERATPELQEAFEEAQKKVTPKAGGTGRKPPPKQEPTEPEEPAVAPPPASDVRGLQHTSVD